MSDLMDEVAWLTELEGQYSLIGQNTREAWLPEQKISSLVVDNFTAYIQLKLKAGGKPVIKVEKLAVSKTKCSALAQKVPSSKDTGLVKYDETYRFLTEDPTAVSKMVEKMSLPDIDTVLQMFEDGEIKEFTMVSKLAKLVVPDIKEVETKKEQYASLYSALAQAFHHSMLNSFYNEKKGRMDFDLFRDALKTRKIEETARVKYFALAQSAMAD